MVIRYLILAICLSMATQNGTAQEKNFPARNTLMGGFTIIGAHFFGIDIYADAHLSYDRIFFAKNKRKVGAQLSAGYYGIWGVGGIKISPRLLILSGKENHHFETTLGLNLFVTGDLVGWVPYMPAVSIGYRYQKPTGGFVFRSALGFRELIQLGFGYSF